MFFNIIFFFFFSSRRRHTRFDCDWSSDVCSSDLTKLADPKAAKQRFQYRPFAGGGGAVIDDLRGTRSVAGGREPFSPGQCAHGFVFSEAGDNSHIDVQIIEPASV